jgi:hypothetical protein
LQLDREKVGETTPTKGTTVQPGDACLRCGGALEEGFIEDSGQSSRGRARWIAGAIEHGLLGGTKVMGKERRDITAYRCTQCGRLDLEVQ